MHPCYVCGGNCNCDRQLHEDPIECFCQECELDLNTHLEQEAVDWLERQRENFQRNRGN